MLETTTTQAPRTPESRLSLASHGHHTSIATRAVSICPVCGSSAKRLLCNVQEHEYDNTTTERFPMVECSDCTLWYLDPRPDDSALGTIYPSNYYAYASPEGAGSKLNENLAARLFRSRFDVLERFQKLGPTTRWLEIGCGQGEVLDGLRKYYGIERPVGLDYSESAVALCRAKGFEAHTLRMEDISRDRFGEFDVVHSSHVIEHVASPLEYARKALELLRPGGICIFATPNTDTWEARLFGRHWGGLHAPRHWTLLNPRSVRVLAERSGFVLDEIVWSRAGNFWTWTLHSLAQAAIGRTIADALFPSDQRINDNSVLNVARTGCGAVLDLINARVFGRSSTMVVVLHKPAA